MFITVSYYLPLIVGLATEINDIHEQNSLIDGILTDFDSALYFTLCVPNHQIFLLYNGNVFISTCN